MIDEHERRKRMGIERRESPRVKLEKGINYRFLDDNKNYTGVSYDISSGGMKLLSFNFLPKDKKILIELQLEDEVVRTTAKVVWTKKFPYSGRYQVGVQFKYPEPSATKESLDSSSEIKKIISEYVDSRIS